MATSDTEDALFMAADSYMQALQSIIRRADIDPEIIRRIADKLMTIYCKSVVAGDEVHVYVSHAAHSLTTALDMMAHGDSGVPQLQAAVELLSRQTPVPTLDFAKHIVATSAAERALFCAVDANMQVLRGMVSRGAADIGAVQGVADKLMRLHCMSVTAGARVNEVVSEGITILMTAKTALKSGESGVLQVQAAIRILSTLKKK